MASSSIDINSAIVRNVKDLSVEAKAIFRKTFSKAPLMLAFLDFLEQQKQEKFKTNEAVLYLYKIKNSHKDYVQYENRFFKLRKKLYDYFHSAVVETHPVFTPQEIQLHEIKNLTIAGRYKEASTLLINFEKKLWDENIFELLPEVLDLAIHNNQMQRKTDENKPLYARLDLANELSFDIIEAKKLARLIYDINMTLGIKEATPFFVKLQRLAIKHKKYPRFKLIYNLISANCKLGGGGLDFKPDFKITNRFIKVITKIHTLHPLMPDYRFIAGYTANQNYIFENLNVMNHFNAFHFRDAANLIKSVYDSVMEENSPLKRMRTPVFFTSSALVFTLGERPHDALKASKDFLSYVVDTNQTNNLLNAYIEIANADVWVYPSSSGFSNNFLSDKIEQYIRSVKDGEYSHYYLGMANWLKIKWLLVTEEYSKAKSVFDHADFTSYFMDKKLGKNVEELILLLLDKTSLEKKRKRMEDLIKTLHLLKLNTKLPPDYANYLFLETFLTRKLKASSI